MGNTLNRYWVYKLISPTNKVYIGITSNIVRRFNVYKNMKTIEQRRLLSALKAHTFESFKKEILFTHLTEPEAQQKEIELISIYKNIGISLNTSDGGQLGSGLVGADHPNSKAIIQLDLIGNYLKIWSSCAEAAEVLGLTNSGISCACRKHTFYSQGYMWIYKLDYDPLAPPVYYDNRGVVLRLPVVALTKDGNFYKEFCSQHDAAEELCINQRNISSCVLGRKMSAGGFLWCAKDDYSNGIIPKYAKNHTGKSVNQYNIDGDFINNFASIAEASRETNVDRGTIIKQCKGKIKTYKKHRWEYAN